MLQPGAFRFLNPVDSSVSLSNYYLEVHWNELSLQRLLQLPCTAMFSAEVDVFIYIYMYTKLENSWFFILSVEGQICSQGSDFDL